MALVDHTGPRETDTVARLSRHNRSFGSTAVLREVDLTIRPGEFIALLGRSGSGKSTLLRSLAGLDPSPAGEVVVDGRTSVAFQEPRLLPWRRVGENVALALLNGTASRQERRERARAALEEVGLTEKTDAWPLSLSGRPGPAGLAGPGPGQRARPAAARRAVQRAGRPDPHRDAPSRRPALAAALAGRPAGHPRRRRGAHARRPRPGARRRTRRPGVAPRGAPGRPHTAAPGDRRGPRGGPRLARRAPRDDHPPSTHESGAA